MTTAIADIAVIVIDYQVPVPEEYGLAMLGPWSSFSDFQMPHDEFKKHLLKDSAFLEALMKAMRIKVIPSEIQRQLDLQQARMDTQEGGNKRKENQTEGEMEPLQPEAKKMKATPLEVNNNLDNESASDEEGEGGEEDDYDSDAFADNEGASNEEREDYYESKTSVHDDGSGLFLSGQGTNKQRAMNNSQDDSDAEEAPENKNKNWLRNYNLLKKYKEKYGNCKVPRDYIPNKKLANWVDHARRSGRKYIEGKPGHQFNEERFQLLNAIDFEWWVNSIPWEKFFSLLQQFKDKHGHCNVPRECNDDENRKLCMMAKFVRQYGKLVLEEKKTSKITLDHVKQLNEMGFTWDETENDRIIPVNESERKEWLENFYLLKEYKDKYGDCKVPKDYGPNKKLASWVDHARRSGRMYIEGLPRNRFNADRFRMLNAIDFEWWVHSIPWEDFIPLLKEFKEKHGHCNVPRECNDDEDKKLCMLAKFVRQHGKLILEGKKTSKINEDQITLLNGLGFTWNESESSLANITETERNERKKWMRNYRLLKEYKESHGDCKVPRDYIPNKKLANWVDHCRRAGRKYIDGLPVSGFNADRFQMLNALDFEWWVISFPWKEFFSMLQDFKEKHRHCYVPRECNSDENMKLCMMAKFVRQHGRLILEGKKTSKITEEHVVMLNGMGFTWNETESSLSNKHEVVAANENERKEWLDNYKLLKEYKEKNGNCRVSKDYANKKLANWVDHARRCGRKYIEGQPTSGCNADRFRMLNALDFEWWVIGFPWTEFIPLLEEYKEKHGHCNVPRECHDDEDKKLCMMAKHVRQHGKLFLGEKKTTKITEEHIKSLNGLGFTWNESEASLFNINDINETERNEGE